MIENTLKYTDNDIAFQNNGKHNFEVYAGDNSNESENSFKNENPDSDECTYKGICINCIKRFDCDLAIANGGVWHCDNYE